MARMHSARFAAAIAISAAGCNTTKPPDPDASSESCPALGVVRSGHRGSGRNAADNPLPENTLPSFAEVVKVGGDSVELDVMHSADGALVIMHDDTVDRTTDGTGCVGERTLEALKELDAAQGTDLQGRGVKVPTLEEALGSIDIDVQIEIKLSKEPCPVSDAERLASDIKAVIDNDDKPREISISSFSPELLSMLAGQGIYLVLHKRDPALARELGLDAVNVKPDEQIAEAIAAARAHGLETLTVTADRDRIRDALRAGANTILTDDLELVAQQQRALCAGPLAK